LTIRVVDRIYLAMADQEFFIDALSDERLAQAYFDITGKLTASIFKLFDATTLVGPALHDAYVNLARSGREDTFRNMSEGEKRDKMLTKLHEYKETLPPFRLTAEQREAMKAEMTATNGNGERCPNCFDTVVPGASQVVYNDCRHFLCLGCHSKVVEVCERENRQCPCYTCHQCVIRTQGFTIEAFVGNRPPITVVPSPNAETTERRSKRPRGAASAGPREEKVSAALTAKYLAEANRLAPTVALNDAKAEFIKIKCAADASVHRLTIAESVDAIARGTTMLQLQNQAQKLSGMAQVVRSGGVITDDMLGYDVRVGNQLKSKLAIEYHYPSAEREAQEEDSDTDDEDAEAEAAAIFAAETSRR
jgi:hypothetical protein